MDPDDDLAAWVAADKAKANQPDIAFIQPPATPSPALAPAGYPDDDLGRMVAADDAAAQRGAAAPPAHATVPAQPDDELSRWVARDTASAKPSSDPLYSTVTPGDTFLQGVVGGVPIVGPALLGGVERAAAYGRSLKNGTSYEDELAHEQFLAEARSHENPKSELAGDLTGAALTLGPVASTEAGGLALGARGASLASRSAAGAASGAAIGAADAGVRSGGDLGDMEEGAKVGVLGGALAPVAGSVIGKAADLGSDAVNFFRPSVNARNAIADDIATSGSTIGDVQSRLASNPRLALMDVNPVLQSKAMGLAGTMEGSSRPIMMDAYNARTAGASGAVQSAYDAAMGPTPNVPDLLNGIRANAAANAKIGFGRALDGAGPVDVTPTIAHIDSQLFPGGVVPDSGLSQPWHGQTEQALLRARASLTNGDSQVVDPNRLHQIQSSLREQATALGKSSSGQDRLTGQALQGVRQNLIGQIDDAAGGAYRPAQKQYADDLAVRDAFDQGLNIFRNRTGAAGLEDRPEVFQDWLDNASPVERHAATQGARVAADSLIRTTRFSARNGSNLPEVPANFDKLQALLGPDEAGTLQRSLQDERAIADTNHKLFDNSLTQPRQAAQASVAVRPVAPFSYGGLSLPVMAEVAGLGHGTAAAGLAAGLLGGGARTVTSAIGRSADIARNASLSQMLSASGSERDELVRQLMQPTRSPSPTPPEMLVQALMRGSITPTNQAMITSGFR